MTSTGHSGEVGSWVWDKEKFWNYQGQNPSNILKLLCGDGDSFFGGFDLTNMYSMDF